MQKILVPDSVLNKTVSMLNAYTDLKPVNVNLIDYLTDDRFKQSVLEIRAITDKSKRDTLKSKLPALMVSGTFKSRGEAGLITHTGLIQFDIDYVQEMDTVREKLMKSPYVAYLSLSVSGRGLFGIIPISNKAKHKQHFAAMQRHFDSLGVPAIDPAPANVSSLRGYSWDENAYFNHHAKTFNYLYEEPVKPKTAFSPQHFSSTEYNPFDEFNKHGNIESLLESHGWKYQHTKGTRKRYSRPGKNQGVSADYCTERKILYLFSSDAGTGLDAAKKGYNNVKVFCQLECGNDWNVCARKLRALGYGLGSAHIPQPIRQTALSGLTPNLNF